MRTFVCVGFMLVAASPAVGQPEKEQPPRAMPSTRTILANLQTEMETNDFDAPTSLGEFLRVFGAHLRDRNKAVTFQFDDEAFREEGGPDAPDLLKEKIQLRSLPAKTSAHAMLQNALRQLRIKSALVIRAGKAEIVPYARTTKQWTLNQTFHAEFSERRLDKALDELSELTGVSIVLDGRAKQKAQTLVTARFHDDVALQDAVRMLSDMAELKLVYLVTGLYVTTPEHADDMQRELRRAYGEPDGLRPGPGGFAPNPMDTQSSPLAPPLPPARGNREAAP